jgi:CRP/FNR family transcriptional regulator, cyclic AMP receptor protein
LGISPLILRQFAPFASWPDDCLAQLAESASLRQLARRQLALTPAEMGEWIGWVIEGGVWLVDHTQEDRESVLGRFTGGDLFGEMHAFGEAGRLTGYLSYVSVGPSKVALVQRRVAWELIGREAQVGQQLVALLTNRMADFFRWRAILGLPSAPERVMAVLAALLTGDNTIAIGQLPAGMTQQEIAAYANTTRETVTRVMQRLQADGVVVRDGSTWQVNRAALEKAQRSLAL